MSQPGPAAPSDERPGELAATPPPNPASAARADATLGLAALGIGLALALWAVPAFVRAPVEPRPLPMAPWFLPLAAAWMLAAGGAALAYAAWRRPRQRGGEGGGEPLGLLRAALATLAYVLLMPLLGAMTTGVLVTSALTLAAGQPPARAALVGLGVPAGAWALFTQLAGTPLPRGPWGLP